ncbi:AmmeMemoRadiSam system protein A [Imhoffiella purpurea]|uniref:AMMECR1 domain-containing protein n=1 Tax=Imhoffiella purpurea TaxID=1249627 RepID=W9V4S5_9GAMM|nr:AmmeMemoRadiSam system protein A [Imhoffiella purpurea]EXJ14548.1 hypothetical protein D779_2689 [Imhoffiella purpurea]
MHSTEPRIGRNAEQTYEDPQRASLIETASRSIAHGLEHGSPLTVEPDDYPEPLREPRATFVTLHIARDLRGCIGVLEPRRPLVVDVAQNAFAAAFEDPRFPRLRKQEFGRLAIQISVLSPAEPIDFQSETELLNRIRPGRDGLILRAGRHRGTFLPSVWEQIPDPTEFLEHLKRKAGLPFGYWSADIEILRYTTESFGSTSV